MPDPVADYPAIVKGIRASNKRVLAIVIAGLLLIVSGNGVVWSIAISNQNQNAQTQKCQNQAFDQVLGELLLNQKITPPPKC